MAQSTAQDVAAGDRAETSGISMTQLPASTETRRHAALGRSQRPEARGLAPALTGIGRPGFVQDAAGATRLRSVGQPLARRTRRLHDRFGRRLVGSGLVHGLVLLLLALSFAQPEGGKLQEPQAVEMLYDRSGSAGMVGPSNAETGGSPPAAPKPVPDLQPPAPVPPSATVPSVAEMPPLPELQIPEPLPQPLPAPAPPTTAKAEPQKVPVRRQAQRSASPFSNPMDLSFSQAPTPPRRLRGRPAGSAAPVDLSLGPLVRNGRLVTPYASTSSIKGVSDDYGDEIGAWIRRHMYYPEDAARRGEDGPSHVHVVLDRQGRVKSVRLVNSSGSYALDDATMGIFRNAQLPPVPPDMSGNSFDVDLTIDYILLRQ
jgi:TonB family protein